MGIEERDTPPALVSRETAEPGHCGKFPRTSGFASPRYVRFRHNLGSCTTRSYRSLCRCCSWIGPAGLCNRKPHALFSEIFCSGNSVPLSTQSSISLSTPYRVRQLKPFVQPMFLGVADVESGGDGEPIGVRAGCEVVHRNQGIPPGQSSFHIALHRGH